MASLKEQILRQSQADKDAFAELTSLMQEALTLEATALHTSISNSHVYWVGPATDIPDVASKRAA